MALRRYFFERRNRNLAVLTAAAVLAAGFAVVAQHHRAAMLAPKYESQAFLPGLGVALNAGAVTRIHITSAKASFDVVFMPTKGWVLPGSGNYPASFQAVKQTLVALSSLETIEPKTDDPALYSYVGLDAPPQGHGVAVTLSGDKGTVARLIIGKTEQRGDSLALFVRKAGEKQSWLVKTPGEIKVTPADWMDKAVIAVDRSRIASMMVEPASGPGYTLAKTAPGEPNFALAPLPKGRVLAYAGAGDSAATLLSDFAFDDIARSTEFDFTSGARMTVQTFDGLTVSMALASRDGAAWVRIFAAAQPGNPAAAKEAMAINARTVGWAFKLPAYKASLFAPALETLLKPKG